MKNLILFIFTLSVCLIGNAQINTNIIGLSLGQSSKQQVNSIIKKYNLPKYEENSTDVYQYIICYGKQFQLLGQTWEYAKFYFLNNKLYTISLSCTGSSSYTHNVFNHLREILDDKYSNFFVKDIVEEGDRYIYFNDGKTSIQLTLMSGYGGYSVGIAYYNIKLKLEENEKTKNNL